MEECNKAIQNPDELKEIVTRMAGLTASRQADEAQQQIDGLTPDEVEANRATLLYLEKMRELDELKAEDAALSAKFKVEKAEQIAANAALLQKISKRTRASETRRRSSIFKS